MVKKIYLKGADLIESNKKSESNLEVWFVFVSNCPEKY